MPSPFTHSRSGMSLMNVIVLLMLIGVLVMAGSALVGPLVKRGKINGTKTIINSNVDAIISWAVANGRLPKKTATTDEITTLFTNPNDAWGRPLVYAYDANLADSSTGGLCGRTAAFYNNIAFIILSGGDDFKTDSTPETSQALTAEPDLKISDIYRVVTLDELKSRSGCYGATGGRLRIVNNELPSACKDSDTYSATLFADGGVPNYTWSLVAPPSWIQINSTTGTLTLPLNTKTPNTPGATYQVTTTLKDNHQPIATTVNRTYNLKVVNCGTTNLPVSLEDFVGPPSNKVQFVYDPATETYTIITTKGTDAGCSWSATPISIPAGKTFSVYFEFVMDEETRLDSGDYGNGFSFTMYNSTQGLPTTTCGWRPLGYDGIGSDTVAIELDTYKDSSNDPIEGGGTRNHLAVQVGSSGHTAGQCSVLPLATPPSCGYRSGNNLDAVRWFENGTLSARHKARIDVTQATGLVRVWLDCTDCSNPGPPTIQRTVTVPASFYYGFTTASQGSRNQSMQLFNFSAGFY